MLGVTIDQSTLDDVKGSMPAGAMAYVVPPIDRVDLPGANGLVVTGTDAFGVTGLQTVYYSFGPDRRLKWLSMTLRSDRWDAVLQTLSEKYQPAPEKETNAAVAKALGMEGRYFVFGAGDVRITLSPDMAAPTMISVTYKHVPYAKAVNANNSRADEELRKREAKKF
ncbi:hypothetical protein M6I34_08265 [Burkholderiaceae bacterium FT117]|uniref:hypothetical protein n=1 Tax=Zeimonas sediminis TaxID=2944268 RepID=UPI002342CF9D|nr:hypothetical protein [Zeimonas sediminis]MCM5570500.1 hypothetical protein [Zeimonas sediminis]